MNNNSTLERMKELRLWGMQQYFANALQTPQHEHLTGDEQLAFLIEAEYDYRSTKRIRNAIARANFRYSATVEEIDFNQSRNLDKNVFLRLADCSFIDKMEDVIFTGSAGVGKSKLASALGYQACVKGYKVHYYNMAKLFATLKTSKADNSYMKEITRIGKQQLIILDDFGLHPFDTVNCLALLEIIEDRHGKASTIIASQVPVSKWHELLGEQTLADAILDRFSPKQCLLFR
jgi:DNA replication protein DnaC